MADAKELEATKMVRKEFAKRPIDISRADIRVMHGVAYVRGILRTMPGSSEPLTEMLSQIQKACRSKPFIRDVVIDATIRE